MDVKRLIIFDHDKTINDSSPLEIESMYYALNKALESIGSNSKLEKNSLDLNEILHKTTGTTEKYLVNMLSFESKIPYDRLETFEKLYYKYRAEWYSNRISEGNEVKEPYFRDARYLVETLSEDNQNLVGLVTGNPKSVFNSRNTKFVRANFTQMHDNEILSAYGEEGLNREDLIRLIIKKAEKQFAFKVETDYLGFTTNVWYIADSRRDLFSALHAKVQFIWIPSRDFKTVVNLKHSPDIKFLDSFLEDRFIITNSLDSSEILGIFK